MSTKISKGAWALSQIRKYVNKQTLRMVYFSLVYSHLQYCITSWGTASKTALDPLYKQQKKIIRIMSFSAPRDHTLPLFYNLQLLTIFDIYKLEVAKFMHFVHNSKSIPDNITQNFKLLQHTHDHSTRSAQRCDYFLPRQRTQLGKKSLSFTGPQIWKEIETDLKEKPLHHFKKLYNDHLLSVYCTK